MIVKILPLIALLFFTCGTLGAQVYSPKLLRQGQPDATDLKKFVAAIYRRAGANTDREKAEAIWRFFLTDGRFVKPGFWYHIAGWTYEEPTGEVLDPMKLLNSYGFGLCYHIAPLLEAMFDAGGFSGARCWFLTGHTVTEVYYEGKYHYFDSDMMGYNVAGDGPFQGKPVASVRDLERDSNIILGKLAAPDKVKPRAVDDPWYPADVRARAMPDLAALFTTAADNYLYPYPRYSSGSSMDFELRPGEKLVRFFAPEEPGLFYLPYKFDGKQWTEFPQELAEYHIRTVDGPRSQKDGRSWATGRMEYTPPAMPDQAVTVLDMPSPYVIIDAHFSIGANLPTKISFLQVDTSTNGGSTWTEAGKLNGPYKGRWSVAPAILAKTAHGRLTAVSGSYGYQVRITKNGVPADVQAHIDSLQLVSRIQLNPRTLPAVQPGANRFQYSAAAAVRRVAISAPLTASSGHDLELIEQNGQQFLLPSSGKTGEAVYALEVNDCLLSGFDAGVRFLDLRNGLAPDKLTAETRKAGLTTASGDASIAWSVSPAGPFRTLWTYPEKLAWLDGDAVSRMLLWPEFFRQIRNLPAGTKRVYVRICSSGPAFDSLRFAVYTNGDSPRGLLTITQAWTEGGRHREHVEKLDAATRDRPIALHAGADVRNESITFAAN